LEILRSLAELDEVMQRGVVVGHEQGEHARIELLCNYIVHDPLLMNQDVGDPFSLEYRNGVLRAHSIISGRDGYQPARDELIPIDPAARAKRPGIYGAGGSQFLGQFLEAMGQILRVADLAPGQRVLEYGPGDGQIALAFARIGFDVTVVDIDPKNLETIRLQAEMFDTSIRAVHGEFEADIEGKFDLVLFFETFHHAINHQDLLRRLHDIVSDNGRILFAAEPIVPEGTHWSDTVPFPWGMRLDALSLQAVKNYGWMELGFRESYFLDVLARTGWQAEFIKSKTNGRGDCYVAKRAAS
jgi:2-polyprenyl-3-methyl-5-hydroxy-6-metoxy-1,4-benzoquinol methylase